MTRIPSASPGHNSSSYSTGLQDQSWMALVRMVFVGTGINLLVFCVLQLLAGNLLFASFELLASLLLLTGAWKIAEVRNPLLLVNLFLLCMFSFLLYIIVMPGASKTAFAWTYIMPVLAYPLLGRVRGGLLSIPFALMAIVFFLYKYEGALDAAGLIDLVNAALCGLLIILFMHVYEGRRAAAHRELQRIAQTDALTGVASRSSFEQALAQSILEAERSHNPLVLVILDVDHFKKVNDRWGHDAGDKALCHICQGLSQRLRISDTLGRLGGEEFGLLLRNTDRAGAEPLVEQLRSQISNNPLRYGNQLIELSATFGVAEWPLDGRTVDDLYRCVDRRLYRGKDAGRNQIVSREAALPPA
ncbi:GGDEF domain-containing protein [Pseudomonas sp. N040]|uniref:GGDEF domain-containing protein n=1 Tax=Pseudomonas sp. N040 TaxID=2785325 RepID=UPI0018A262DA|nr:GGDEF domain-containing protein [Pseudomonas sp. N040]MBF7729580.1 GGDEF domain-containing protein [Pseudomonas sp. N040]MBW7013220.1 GGDEF domain-containing protein [Pseudomonas sp. N040]